MKMKMTRFIPKHKLKATARQMPKRAAMEDFAEEPNMSFVKALVVVVILHIVAVGGIYAFKSVKTQKNITVESAQPAAQEASAPSATEDKPAARTAAQTAAAPVTHAPVKAADSKPAIANAEPKAADTHKKVEEPAKTVPVVKPAAATKTTAAAAPTKETPSATTYTVVKGDNPVTIARKFHTTESELLKLNKIDDPKKLQIGQKLKIPAKKS